MSLSRKQQCELLQFADSFDDVIALLKDSVEKVRRMGLYHPTEFRGLSCSKPTHETVEHCAREIAYISEYRIGKLSESFVQLAEEQKRKHYEEK